MFPKRIQKLMKFVISMSVIIAFISSTTISYSNTGLSELQKGVCYATWSKDGFSTQYSDASLEKMAEIGIEYVQIVATHYQEKYNSTKIKPTDLSPDDSSVKHVIKQAHKLGLKVMLKPHVDLIDRYDGTYWRADIGFTTESDWNEWFKSYTEFITNYAKMAQYYDVEIFCVGTELEFTTTKDDKWREVISAIKKEYKGKLVYASNWDNFKNVKFWDELDYAGIDAYFPLTNKANPDLEELKKGWDKWKFEIAEWAKSINKPVLFTEIGYPSTSHAPYTPWQEGCYGNPDLGIQAKCYEAFFETIWNEPWLKGVYWWKWDTSVHAGGQNNRQFTPQNKPAEKILETRYKDIINAAPYAVMASSN